MVGSYTLKDNSNKVLTNNLNINPNGQVIGFPLFENKFVHYSTDIYCGPPTIDDFVLFCDDVKIKDYDCSGFVYKKFDQNTIYLYDTFPRLELEEKDKTLGIEIYRLIKN